MIHFLVKFLICLAKPKPPEAKEPVKKKKGSLNKTSAVKRKNKRSKSQEQQENKVEEVSPPAMINEDIIECNENAREWCSIEYCLIEDHLPKVEINVVSWGDVAKVYTLEDCRALKTLVMDDVVWVYFTMHHKIAALDYPEIFQFKNGKVKFTFSENSKKYMAQAENDSPKEFEVYKNVNEFFEKKIWFYELRQTNPIIESYDDFLRERECTYNICHPTINSLASLLELPPYDMKIITKIREVMTTLPPVVKASQNLDTRNSKNLNTKKNKQKKGKKKESLKEIIEDIDIAIRGEVLIAKEVDIFDEKKNISPSLRYAAVFVNATSILTEEQECTLMPIVVTVQKLDDLPFSFLKDLRLKNIYVRYELAGVIDGVETNKVPLTKKDITLNSTRVFFLSSVEEKVNQEEMMLRPSMLSLAEALLTRRLVVKLYGQLDNTEANVNKVEPRLFGELPNDDFISTPGHEMFINYKPPEKPSLEVFLGSACFNLIQLIKGHRSVEISSVLSSAFEQSWDPASDVDGYTLESVLESQTCSSLMQSLTTRGCVPDSIFIDNSSSVKIKVTFFCSPSCLQETQLKLMTDVFNRFVVIFRNPASAAYVVKKIHDVNKRAQQSYLTTNMTPSSVLKSFYSSLNISQNIYSSCSSEFDTLDSPSSLEPSSRSSSSVVSNLKTIQGMLPREAITGFLIRSEEEAILVVEAVTSLMDLMMAALEYVCCPNNGKVLCDTSLFFTKRLYGKFYPLNTFTIDLKAPLDSLIKEAASHTKQYFPIEGAFRTLLLLDLLRRSTTLNSVCVNQLFPSYDQLTSFNNVFGINRSRRH